MSEMDSPAWPRHASSSAGCSSASARPEAIAWLMPVQMQQRRRGQRASRSWAGRCGQGVGEGWRTVAAGVDLVQRRSEGLRAQPARPVDPAAVAAQNRAAREGALTSASNPAASAGQRLGPCSLFSGGVPLGQSNPYA